MRRLSVVPGLLLVLLCCALPAYATVRAVPLTYPTIQSAIDASVDGDTVLVSPGTYFENIDFKGKGITVTSTLSTDLTVIANASATTIIDGSSKAPAVTSTMSANVPSLLSYLTVQHGGSTVAGGSPSNYGGVYISGSGPNLTGNIITQNNFGGVVAPDGNALIASNTIINNTCWGIVGQSLTITGNEITTTQTPAIGCTVTDSSATYTTNSAGILLLGGASTVIGNTIEHNVQLAASGAPVEGGAGIAIYGGSQLIQNNIIRNNSAPGGRGGAIDVIGAQESVIFQNLIYGNHAGCGGAAIAFDSGGIQGVQIQDITIFYFFTHGLVVANNTIADNVSDVTSGCPVSSQVAAGADGVSSPEILFVNNIITGDGSQPAAGCQATDSTLFTQAVYDHNLLYNAGAAFFGTSCIDESMNSVLGNIVANPQFVNSKAGNYRLAAGSPAIDAGNNSVFEASTVELMTTGVPVYTFDLAGSARVQNATGKIDGSRAEEDVIDMGAYESAGASAPKSVAGVFMQPTGYSSMVGNSVLTAFVNSNLGLSPFAPPEPSTTCCVILSDVPSGTLTFFMDGVQVGTPAKINNALWTETGIGHYFYPMASGLANTSVFFTPGTHVLTSTYQPSPGVTTAASIGVVVNIANEATHLLLEASPLNATVGTAVTFTVYGSSDFGGFIPTPVTLYDFNSNKVLATINLDPTTGVGTFTTTTLPVGPNVIQADFAGIGIYQASVSNQVGVFATTPTSLSLSSSTNPAYALVPFTLTAHMTPMPVFSVPEYVYFYAPAATGVLQQIGVAVIDATGTATATVSLPAGTYKIFASYGGDEYYGASQSPAIVETVLGTSTSLTLSSGLNPANAFQPIPLKAHISAPASVPVGSITGTITFVVNGTTVNSGTIDANGDATANVSLPAGTYSIVASFAGSASFSPSQSAAIIQVVNADTTLTTLSVTPNPGYSPTGTETLTATVAAASSNVVPTGTITFYDNFNNAITALQGVTVGANGQAILVTSTLAPGVHRLTASYTATPSFQASTSAPIVLTIILSDFGISTQSSITIQAEHHALLPVTLTSVGAFTDSIQISCSNLPQWLTCNFPTGPSVGLSENGAVSMNIDLDTDQALDFASTSGDPSSKRRRETMALALLLPIALFSLRRRRHSKGMRLLTVLLSFAIGTTLVGCTGMLPNHTAPGSYIVTLTAKGAATGRTHTATFTVIVTQ